MITAEGIKNVNERVKKVEIKGKYYACVAARVAAFRELCPEGSITTEIVGLDDGVVTMKATITNDAGRILATGMAQEKESSSFINKTSFIENCETSAVGRALGMLGIGSDEQMASAEEVANAINNQKSEHKPATMHDRISPNMVKTLRGMAKRHHMPEQEICDIYEVDKIEDLTLGNWQDWAKNGEGILKDWDEAYADRNS